MSHRRHLPDDPRGTSDLRALNLFFLQDTSGEDGEPSECVGTFDTKAEAMNAAESLPSWQIVRNGTVVEISRPVPAPQLTVARVQRELANALKNDKTLLMNINPRTLHPRRD
jgi:hypothetical protein